MSSGGSSQGFDEMFAHIAQRAGNVNVLLTEFFSFLHRRTDFYVEYPNDNDAKDLTYTMGFPTGVAERMVLHAFRQFPMKNYNDHAVRTNLAPPQHPPIGSENSSQPSSSGSKGTIKLPISTLGGKQVPIGNGGIGPNYYWTQNLRETTIYVDVDTAVRGKSVDCVIKPSSLTLSIHGVPFLVGEFEETVRVSESTWTLSKGGGSEQSQIIITVEKLRETWWKHAFVGHPEIDTTKVRWFTQSNISNQPWFLYISIGRLK